MMKLNHVFAVVLAVFAVSAHAGTPELGASFRCLHDVAVTADHPAVINHKAISFTRDPSGALDGSMSGWSSLEGGIALPYSTSLVVLSTGVKVASWSAMDMSIEASSVYATATQRWEKATGVDMSQVASIEIFSSEEPKPTFAMGVFYDADGQVIASGGSMEKQHFSCDKLEVTR
jgi:hypothetical protein